VRPNIKYILDAGGKPSPEPDLFKWAEWFEDADRKVAHDRVGDCEVSTVFIGLDYSFTAAAEPVLWETMVFGGPLDQHLDRCTGNREQAEAMHARMVARVKESIPQST